MPSRKEALVPPNVMACRGAWASRPAARSRPSSAIMLESPLIVASASVSLAVWMETPSGAMA